MIVSFVQLFVWFMHHSSDLDVNTLFFKAEILLFVLMFNHLSSTQ